jgi:DNA-binding Lrp family transcriptional regulator
MITAIVLLQVASDAIGETAQAVAALEGVSEVWSVTGEWEVVAIVRVRTHEDIAAVVTGGIAKTPGVLATNTMIAFQQFSQGDLDRLWGVGLEGAEGV